MRARARVLAPARWPGRGFSLRFPVPLPAAPTPLSFAVIIISHVQFSHPWRHTVRSRWSLPLVFLPPSQGVPECFSFVIELSRPRLARRSWALAAALRSLPAASTSAVPRGASSLSLQVLSETDGPLPASSFFFFFTTWSKTNKSCETVSAISPGGLVQTRMLVYALTCCVTLDELPHPSSTFFFFFPSVTQKTKQVFVLIVNC